MNVYARRSARQYAMQGLYQWQIAGASATEIEAQFIAHQINKKTDLDYFKELVHGVPAKNVEIDAAMEPSLKRPILELDPVELAILRLATYELLFRPDIPYRVIINEALELTKKFGSVEGFKFVNGVLDQVAKRIRVTEIAADAKKKNG
jgi:transcription antitermination protein NusB